MANKNHPDFSGWVTKYGTRCSDGVTIQHGAFSHQDDTWVPMVWQHDRGKSGQILGKIYLRHMKEGVYGDGYFNETDSGKNAKELVKHGDINKLSIYASDVKRESRSNYVAHANIEEVSLVVSGANPGAFIDVVQHAMSTTNDEADLKHFETFEDYVIAEEPLQHDYEDEDSYISDFFAHAEDGTVGDYLASLPVELQEAIAIVIAAVSMEEEGSSDLEDPDYTSVIEESIEMIDSLPDSDADTIWGLINAVANGEDGEGEEENPNPVAQMETGGQDTTDVETSESTNNGTTSTSSAQIGDVSIQSRRTNQNDLYHEGGNMSTKSIFGTTPHKDDIKHVQEQIVSDLKHGITLKDSILKHSTDVDNLFSPPHEQIETIYTQQVEHAFEEWILNSISKSPFSKVRVRQLRFSDIEDDVAKGYVRQERKVESTFQNSIRTYYPQTIYITESLERDDILDITDFDIVKYMYQFMVKGLRYELAKAIMVGDGRAANATIDGQHVKIKEECVAPIYGETSNAYRFWLGNLGSLATSDDIHPIIRTLNRMTDQVAISPNRVMVTTEPLYLSMLNSLDENRDFLFKSKAELCARLGVADIKTTTFLNPGWGEGITSDHGFAIYDPKDYVLGCQNNGSQLTKFEDFDIQYNLYRYLLETRVSGAFTVESGIVAGKISIPVPTPTP